MKTHKSLLTSLLGTAVILSVSSSLVFAKGPPSSRNITLMQLSEMRAQEQRQNLASAGQGLGQSAGIYNQFAEQPRLRQIGSLLGSQNTMIDPMANQYERAAQIAQGSLGDT